MNNPTGKSTLASLDDWELEHSSQDLRGQTLVTPDGKPIGRVDDMLVDTDRERVAALRLEDNRIINVDAVDIRGGKPVLLTPADRLKPAPANLDRNQIGQEHIPIVEEKMEIGKRDVDLGTVRIRKRVVEEPVRETVELREEHVNVERRPASGTVSPEDARAFFKEETIEVPEHAEKIVAKKEARVTGEVVVGKETETHRETVEDKVRHTEVDVDRKPGSRR